MKLFVSYSRDDKNYVYELAQMLKDDADYDVWLDRRLVGADLWWDTILDEIEQADCFVMVMTPRSITSIFCQAELNYALALRKPIVPLMLKHTDLPSALKSVQYITIENASLYKVLFLCTRAIGKIEQKLVQGGFPKPEIMPLRPSVPEPDGQDMEHVYEVFATAEEAVAERNWSLAKALFNKVLEVDPHGLGLAARERLDEINRDSDRLMAYEAVVRLASNPVTLRGGRVAWRAFTQKYGTDYDPQELEALFSAEERKVPQASIEILQQRRQTQGFMAPMDVDMRTTTTYAVMDEEPFVMTEAPDVLAVLPAPFEWCEIPEGKVTLEDARQRLPTGSAGGEVEVDRFMIAKYPITNAQYQVFVDADDGYCEPTWWDYSAEARSWRARAPEPKPTAFPGEKLPRTCVNWYDAMAFCFWLSARLIALSDNAPISSETSWVTLPTEAQWQRAAQGDEAWVYPWGNDYDATRCNVKDNETAAASAVDAYPQGASPFGVMDTSGNVREWCLSQWVTGSDDLNGKMLRVLRGGSFYGSESKARCAYRYANVPDLRLSSFGFRVALSGIIVPKT
ncbi:MAG: hypothetical protein OHK0046_03090 [Anaerolineae bacterium]